MKTAASEVWQSRPGKHLPCQKMGLNHSCRHCPQIDVEPSALHCVCCEGCESRSSLALRVRGDLQKTTWMVAVVRERKEQGMELVPHYEDGIGNTLGRFLAFSFLYITWSATPLHKEREGIKCTHLSKLSPLPLTVSGHSCNLV